MVINSHKLYAEIGYIVIVLTECVVSDQTEYNFNVGEIVAESLRSEARAQLWPPVMEQIKTISRVFLFLAWDCGVNSSSLDNSTELPESFSASVSGGFSAASACYPEGSGWLSSDESAAPSASLFFLVSKLLERHVAVQLRQHLDNNDLLDIFQSA